MGAEAVAGTLSYPSAARLSRCAASQPLPGARRGADCSRRSRPLTLAAALARVLVPPGKLVRHPPELILRLTLAGDAAQQVMQLPGWPILHGRFLPAWPARKPARLAAANAG